MYRVQIAGTITKVERKTLGNQDACTVTVPANYRVKNGDQWEDATDWYDATFWGEDANKAEQRYRKGAIVLLEGRPEVRTYQGQNGETRIGYRVQQPFITIIRQAPKDGENGNGQTQTAAAGEGKNFDF